MLSVFVVPRRFSENRFPFFGRRFESGGMAQMVGMLGFLASLAWIGAVGAFLYFRIGLEEVQALPLDQLASLVLALVVPIALFWLLAAYRQQGRALDLTQRRLAEICSQMHNASERADEQSRITLENSLSAKASSFATYMDLRIGDQIDKSIEIAEAIAISGTTEEAKKELEKAIVQARTHFVLGRKQVYCVLIATCLSRLDRKTTSARLMEATPAMAAYCTSFEDMLVEAKGSDESGKLLDYLKRSSLGDAYLAICQFTGRKSYFDKPASTTLPNLTAS